MRSRKLSYLAVVLSVGVHPAISQEPEGPVIAVVGGRLSVKVDNIPVHQLLNTIRQAAGVAISASQEAEQQFVTAEFRNAAMEEGLRKLLDGHDAFFLYSAEGTEQASLKAVWVYRRGEARGLTPAPPEALQQIKEVRVKLSDSDPAVRIRAFRTLLGRAGSDAHEAIAAAVRQERDDNVRGSMIEAVTSSGSELPPEMWGSLMNDPVEHIRILALDALQGSPNLRQFAAIALSDPSPHIRQRAEEIVKELDAAAKSGVIQP